MSAHPVQCQCILPASIPEHRIGELLTSDCVLAYLFWCSVHLLLHQSCTFVWHWKGRYNHSTLKVLLLCSQPHEFKVLHLESVAFQKIHDIDRAQFLGSPCEWRRHIWRCFRWSSIWMLPNIHFRQYEPPKTSFWGQCFTAANTVHFCGTVSWCHRWCGGIKIASCIRRANEFAISDTSLRCVLYSLRVGKSFVQNFHERTGSVWEAFDFDDAERAVGPLCKDRLSLQVSRLTFVLYARNDMPFSRTFLQAWWKHFKNASKLFARGVLQKCSWNCLKWT